MADSKVLKPFVLSFEGGYCNNRSDRGGATNKGVTIATFRSVFGKDKTIEDLKNITDEQWEYIFKKYYWDACKADLIKDQSVANLLVDFAYNSGVARVSRFIQKIVGVTADGIIGSKTINAINSYPRGQRQLFATLKQRRKKHYDGIVEADPKQKKFYDGWMNRLGDIGYGTLTYKGKEHSV